VTILGIVEDSGFRWRGRKDGIVQRRGGISWSRGRALEGWTTGEGRAARPGRDL
jgi:hypothetical protein